MGIANKTSTYEWQYQAVVGTAIITAVNSPCFELGEYNDECGKWNSPFVENPSEPRWSYDSRTPTLTDLETKYPNKVICQGILMFTSLHSSLYSTPHL